MSQYRVKIPSPEIFVKCREELKLSLEDAIRLSNVKSLAKIEKGEKEPTVKQLESLASTYFQPKWIFSEKSLPSNYNYNFTSEFRTIDKNNLNLSYEVKRLIKEVEALREIMIDLKEQTDEPVLEFSPPLGDKLSKAGELARKTRDWLGISIEQQFKWKDEKEAFKKWREVLESKEIFIFLTSNYKGTFKIEIEAMRGFSLYFKKMPIIVINKSDSYNAQAFTLFHELAHILKKQTQMDFDFDSNKSEEVFCNEFASHLLLPDKEFSSEKNKLSKEGLSQKEMLTISQILEKVARKFKVSRETIARRLLEEKIITQKLYQKFKKYLNQEYYNQKEKMKSSPGGPTRERQKEILQQFGRPYVITVLNAYYNQELTINKACDLLDAKKIKYISKLGKIL